MLGFIAGIAVGFFFKPQIEEVVVKVVKKIKDRREHKEY
jgi:hypothetical protein